MELRGELWGVGCPPQDSVPGPCSFADPQL